MFRTKAYKWLFANVKSVIWQILFLTLLGVGISYVSVRFALATQVLLDSATGVSDKPFFACVINLAALLVLDISLQSLYSIMSVRLGAVYKNRLQRNLFSCVMTRDFAGIGEFHSGEIINRLTKDISIVSGNVIDLIPTVVMLVSGVVMSFVALARLDLSLALICIALGPVVIASSALYGRRVKNLHAECRRSDGTILSFMQECIQNLTVIKAFRNEKKVTSYTGDLQRHNYKLNMKVGYTSLAVNVLYFLAMTAAYYFAVAWCAYKIQHGIMTIGAFTAIVQLVGSVQSPFRDISGTVTQFFATCASAERIMEIEDIASDEPQGEPLTDFDRLELNDICFAYDEEYVLDGASLSFDKGDAVVISGASGKGKSTLFKLLLGMYKPGSGDMCIYNKEEKISISPDTRSLFAYVPQGNMIISGTIAENIAFFDDNPDRLRLEQAAQCACIPEYANTLPDGMDTIIGENGAGLSEGQVQRIAVARAIYADASIILLDEATSALDDDTEARILSNIKELKGKTCVMITHRKAAFDIANKSFVLDDKKFSETAVTSETV